MATTVLPLPPTTDVQIVRVVKALFDAAPGYTYLTAFKDFANANGGVAALANALVGVTGKSGDALADLIVANLKLTGDAATAGKAYLAAQFAQPKANVGQIIVDAMNALAGLGNDPNFGAAANAFNASVAKAYAYSTNPANTTTELATLQQADEEQTNSGQTFTLTNGPDVATANVFNAPRGWTAGGTDQVNTLDDDDILTGTGDNPTLNFTFVDDRDVGSGSLFASTPTITPTLRGIQTVNVSVQGQDPKRLDLQDASGVENISIARVNASNQMFVQNIADTVKTLTINDSQAPTGKIQFTFLSSAVSGAADAVALNLNNVNVGELHVEENAASPTEGYETINLSSKKSANTVGVLQAEDLKTLNIAGDKALTLGNTGTIVNGTLVEATTYAPAFANVAGSLTKIDASAFEADLSVNLGRELNAGLDNTSGSSVQMEVIGGKGNDKFVLTQGASIDATATNTDKINGGEGNNTLVILGGDDQNVAALATPNLTNIQALEIRAGHDDGLGDDKVTVNADAFDKLATIYVRNEGSKVVQVDKNTSTVVAAPEKMTVNLNNLTAAQATAITLAHGTTGNSDIANNNLNVTFKTAGTANAIQVTLVDGVNTDPVFNARITATSGELVTLVDSDTESNTIHLNQAGVVGNPLTQAGSTITLKGGAAGQYMNLDSFNGQSGGAGAVNPGANGYGYATDGSAGSNTTVVAAAAAIPGVPVTFSTSQRDPAVASVFYGTAGTAGDNVTRHAVENIVADEYVGDVVVRLGDLTRADGVSSMRITTGSGNDTIIFDAIGSTSAGFTSGDTIAAGKGIDTLVLDGNTATIPGTPRINHQTSEWDNLSGIDVLRFGNNAGVPNVGNNNHVTNGGGAYYAHIDNDFVSQTDAGNRLTVVNNDGDLNTNSESDLVLDLRGLSQNKWVTFIGANGVGNPGISSNRIVVDDISANQNMILNGGDTDVRSSTTPGYVAGNNNVLEIRNTANVSISDLSQVSNFGQIRFTNDQAVTQTLTLTLNNAVVEALVDSSNTATSAATQELLGIVAFDNGAVSSALNIDARAVNGFHALSVTGATGKDVVTLDANIGGSAHIVDLGDSTDRVNWTGGAPGTIVTIDMGAGDKAGYARFQLGAVTTEHNVDNVEIVDLTGLTYATSTVASRAGQTVIGGAGADNVDITAAVLTDAGTANAILGQATTINGFTGIGKDGGDVIKIGAPVGNIVQAKVNQFADANDITAVNNAFSANGGGVDIAYINQGANRNVYVFVDLNGSDTLDNGDAVVVLTGVGTGEPGSAITWKDDIIAYGTGGGTGGGATGNVITVPTSSGNKEVAGTAGRDIFTFDVATALADASGQNTQVTINGFTTGTTATSDVLRLDLPTANPEIKTLAQLNGLQGVDVQVNPFGGKSTLINFGSDTNGGEPVTITLAGIVDPAQVAVEVV
jgi:hypothetical protein